MYIRKFRESNVIFFIPFSQPLAIGEAYPKKIIFHKCQKQNLTFSDKIKSLYVKLTY